MKVRIFHFVDVINWCRGTSIDQNLNSWITISNPKEFGHFQTVLSVTRYDWSSQGGQGRAWVALRYGGATVLNHFDENHLKLFQQNPFAWEADN